MDLRYILDLYFNDSDVLCFYRKNKSQGAVYRRIISDFCVNYLNVGNSDSISEYIGSAKYYVDIKKYSVADFTNEDFDVFKKIIDVPSIMRRERIFRKKLNYYQAHDLIMSVTKFFMEFFKKRKYKILVMQIVDNYVSDIMVRVARHYNVQIIGVVNFFHSGYIRITVEGEHNLLRNVDDEEVDRLYNSLVAKEKTVFKLDKKNLYKVAFKQYCTYKFKYLLHYIILHKLIGKLEYEYIGTPSFEYPNKIKNFFPWVFFESDYTVINMISKSELVYIPLHYFPEATTEYWVDDPSVSPYYPSLYETIQRLADKGYKVVVKEHPAFIFRRDLSVYKKIKSIKNVFLIDPFVSTYKLLEFIENVVVWTGTSGIEAIIQNKRVSVVTENYYSNNMLPHVDDIHLSKEFNDLEKRSVIKRVLENCLPI